MQAPVNPIGSEEFEQWFGDSTELMDTSVVAEIILERTEMIDLMNRGVIERKYGGGSLLDEYLERR